jgi:hypothetical protein
MKPLITLLTVAVVFSCFASSAHADRKSREEEKARQQRLERQLQDVEYILKHERDGTLRDRKDALKDMIATGVAPDEAYWQAGCIKNGDQWVSVQERWLTPKREKRLDEYVTARKDFADSDEGHYKLAQWCAENGYNAQAYAHLKAVLLNHPDHAGLRKLLGYQKIGYRWMNAEEYEAAVREADRLAKELQQWGPAVAKIQEGLNSGNLSRQATARRKLNQITEVSAVPALELILLPSSDLAADACVNQLCKIDHRRSSIALCKAAMFLPDSASATKQIAIEELRTRPLEDFVPVVLGKMRTPLTAQFEFFRRGGWEYSYGPFNMPYKYHVWKESQRFALAISNESMYETRKHALHLLSYDLCLHFDLLEQSRTTTSFNRAFDVFRMMNENLSFTGKRWRGKYLRGVRNPTDGRSWVNAVRTAQLNIEDVMPDDPIDYEDRHVERIDRFTLLNRRLESQNELISELNDRLTYLMGAVTEQSRYENPEYWWHWWKSYIEVDPGKQERVVNDVLEVAELIHVPLSCFTAGTPVWTDRGPRPIEQLHVGDIALSKDVETGELAYRPIIRTTTREPKPLVTIDLGAEQITSTGGHPFFVPGEGWVRARELKAGQFLHTPTGTIKIDCVTETPEDETYNLVVDGFHTYFVGMSQALVHDVSITSPTDAVVPGLLDR